MPATLSPGMQNITMSATSAMVARVAALRREGRKIISLNVGEPDFPTPAHIKAAGIKAIEDDFTHYTTGVGIYELREAIAEKLKKENHVCYTPEEILVLVGAKQALYLSLMAIAADGDEVIIPTPCYVSYPEIVRLTGAKAVFCDLKKDTYELDLQAIEEAVSPATKAIIICSPNNPTGTVYSEESLRALTDLAVRYDFFILSDEVYEKLVYGGARHFSPASASPEAKERVITINAFSKSYAMTGWRIGYAAAREDVIRAMNILQTHSTTCMNSISQKAAIAALQGPQKDVELMRREFERRRNYVLQRLRTIPGLSCPDIHGAFYVFFDMSAYVGSKWKDRVIENDVDFCSFLLEEAGVALMPGTPFYGANRVRISYAASMQNLRSAMDIMEVSLKQLTRD